MNIVPFLCVVALCVNQVISVSLAEVKENLKRLEEEVQDSIESLGDTVRDIERYRKNLQLDFNHKISEGQSQNNKRISCMTNLFLEDIRVLVGDAKAEGKKPDKCYENSEKETSIASADGYKNVDKCTTKATEYVDTALSTIDKIIESGQTLIDDLGKIFPSCNSKLPRIMLKCVNRKKKVTDATMKKFESNTASIKNIGDTASADGYRYGLTCYKDVMMKIRDRVRDIRIDFQYCVSYLKKQT